MANYMQEAFLRIDDMLVEAVASERDDIDIAFWPYQQEGPFPYVTKRWGPSADDLKTFDEFIEVSVETVLLRLVMAHIDAGQTDGIQDESHIYMVLIKDYFRKHPMLTTDAGTYADQGPDYLLFGSDVFQAPMLSHTGVVVFINSGIGAQQLGCEFTLRLPYLRDALP